MTKLLTIADFSDKQGDDFQMIFNDGTSLDLTLTEVRPEKRRMPDAARDPFSLIFDGTRDVLCPQRIYFLRHASGWEAEIFMVPVGRNHDGTYRYQAIFN